MKIKFLMHKDQTLPLATEFKTVSLEAVGKLTESLQDEGPRVEAVSGSASSITEPRQAPAQVQTRLPRPAPGKNLT